jgi:hypothetical protein
VVAAGVLKMCESEPQTQSKTDGPKEPGCIHFIGGSLSGKSIADTGQLTYRTSAGEVYKRVAMDVHDDAGTIHVCVLGYFGKVYDQE